MGEYDIMDSVLFTRKNLERTICVACGKAFGEHTKDRSKKFNTRELMKCMFRIQASYVLEAKKKDENSDKTKEETPNET
jgi:hypothetical protein